MIAFIDNHFFFFTAMLRMCEEHVPPELNKVGYHKCCETFVSRQVFPEMIKIFTCLVNPLDDSEGHCLCC